jgi:hypothetical protein
MSEYFGLCLLAQSFPIRGEPCAWIRSFGTDDLARDHWVCSKGHKTWVCKWTARSKLEYTQDTRDLLDTWIDEHILLSYKSLGKTSWCDEHILLSYKSLGKTSWCVHNFIHRFPAHIHQIVQDMRTGTLVNFPPLLELTSMASKCVSAIPHGGGQRHEARQGSFMGCHRLPAPATRHAYVQYRTPQPISDQVWVQILKWEDVREATLLSNQKGLVAKCCFGNLGNV